MRYMIKAMLSQFIAVNFSFHRNVDSDEHWQRSFNGRWQAFQAHHRIRTEEIPTYLQTYISGNSFRTTVTL